MTNSECWWYQFTKFALVACTMMVLLSLASAAASPPTNLDIDAALAAARLPEEDLATASRELANIMSRDFPAALQEQFARCVPMSSGTLIGAAGSGDLASLWALIGKPGVAVDAVGTCGHTALQLAAATNQLEAAKVLLLHGAGVEAPRSGTSPLCIAALVGHQDMVELLLDNGASPTGDCLCIAAIFGHVHIVKLLVARGADLNDRVEIPEGEHERRMPGNALAAAAMAGHVEIVDFLLKNGADLNAVVDDEENTALHGLMLTTTDNEDYGSVNCLQTLLSRGAQPDVANKMGQEPVHLAARHGRVHALAVLFDEGVSVNQKTRTGFAPLHFAAANGQLETVRFLLAVGAEANSVADDGETPLTVAASMDSAIVQALIDGGADPVIGGVKGWAPLLRASAVGNRQAVEQLIAAGADVNCKNDEANTPLHEAASGGYVEIVALLIKAGANTAAATNQGWTALHCAAHAKAGHPWVVRALLLAGADVAAVTTEGYTALHLAVQSPEAGMETIQALLGAGVDVTVATAVDGQTALHYAVEANRADTAEVVEALTRRGASVTQPNGEGLTARDIVGHNAASWHVRKLLRNPVGRGGVSLLHEAARAGDVTTVSKLVGISSEYWGLQDDQGRTPYDYAVEGGHSAAISILWWAWVRDRVVVTGMLVVTLLPTVAIMLEWCTDPKPARPRHYRYR